MKDMVTQPILSLRDLSVHRGAAKILDRVTLSLAEGETLAPAEADLGSEVVWVWTNRARTRLRFCVGRGFSHASWDSRTGTVVAKRRPKCPQTPSGARIDLDQLSTRWLR